MFVFMVVQGQIFCGQPKLRLKRIFQISDCEKCEKVINADEGHIVHSPDEDDGSNADELKNSSQMSENVSSP